MGMKKGTVTSWLAIPPGGVAREEEVAEEAEHAADVVQVEEE